ncbi:hypothetical protein Mal64_21390 [Pseudobythopirellula maris]|uniref:Uncharacterized protein n=1 Tax=Pseudobythopirellula maris TaxID=2527991 RepID=A0A5C5ZMG9_9BACT|nr:hypothetical protein Mal64_21390 [Pseudobythopirellula maris]
MRAPLFFCACGFSWVATRENRFTDNGACWRMAFERERANRSRSSKRELCVVSPRPTAKRATMAWMRDEPIRSIAHAGVAAASV